jgi:phage protein D
MVKGLIMLVIQSYYKILYNGKNITADLSQHLLELSYTDKVTGESDELEIVLEDKDGKWSNEWYPDKGASLTIEFGYNNGQVIKPNAFELDEIVTNFSLDGDTVIIKAVGAAFIKSKIKSSRSYAHENKTLREIVNTIAARYGLQVIGDIAHITIGRVTQKREKDITFLSRLASEYGYNFSVRGKKLIFTHILTLEGVKQALSIDKTDILGGSITDKSSLVFSAANVKSHNPNTNRVVKSTANINQVQNKDGIEFTYIKEGPTHEIRTRTENEQQGRAKAEAALHRFNGLQQTASLSLPGNVLALAGNNTELTGFGRNSGVWNILSSRHMITRSGGYEVDLELKKIIPSSVSGSRTKPKAQTVKKQSYSISTIKNRDGVQFTKITSQ